MTSTPVPASAPASALTPEDAQKVLAGNFAPWVLDLGLAVVETSERHAVLRLPWSERLAREGGGLSGQALMAAADTATVIAVASARGGFTPMTTVQQSTSFLRAVQGADVLLDARIGKLGKRMAFVDITMTAEGPAGADGPAARASTVYALLG